MIRSNVKRLMGATLVVPIALLALAATASAKEPTGDFAVYKQCPNPGTPPPGFLSLCIVAKSEGGIFQVGKISAPVTNTQTLQGGILENEETGHETFLPAENGESLVRVAQVVPGGIFAIVKEGHYPSYLRQFCRNFPNSRECRVTATAELVGEPTISRLNLLFAEGIALGVPLRLHLKNPFLGGKCYVGSASSPIQANYTSGKTNPPPPNVPIEGSVGQLEIIDEGQQVIVKHNLVVDNTFSAPGAEGCGGPQAVVVDKEIDTKNGLPSPAGHNESRLSGTLYNATLEGVLNSEV